MIFVEIFWKNANFSPYVFATFSKVLIERWNFNTETCGNIRRSAIWIWFGLAGAAEFVSFLILVKK